MSVLLLNASYEPLRVISWQRAICLQLADRADLVESLPDRHLHSSGGQAFPFPSVVRLREMVKVPFRREVPITRKALVARDRGQCQKDDCSRKGSTMDHLVPRSRGGGHDWMNVVLMCHEHNNSKGAHTLEELGWRLKRRPTPPSFETALLGRHHLMPQWLQWLSDPHVTQLAAAG